VITCYADLINDTGLRLTAFETRCALAWPGCETDAEVARQVYSEEYADLEGAPRRKLREFDFEARARVRHALQRVTERLTEVHGPEMLSTARRGLQREAFDAVRGRQKRSGAAPLAGLEPYLDCSEMTYAEYLAALRNPRNHRQVSLRSPLVGARAVSFNFSQVDCLQQLQQIAG